MHYAMETQANAYPGPDGSDPTISAVLGQAHDHGQQLHDVISKLEERIAPILSPEPPMSGEKLNEVRAVASDLRTSLGEHSATLSHARDRLQQLLARIEL